MTWKLTVRGAHSQPLLQDFACPDCGPFSSLADRDNPVAPCPDCGGPSEWHMSAPIGSVKQTEVVRGGVAKADSPMFLDTRPLGEGMPMKEWRAKRDKIYEERRHKESKEFARFCKGGS